MSAGNSGAIEAVMKPSTSLEGGTVVSGSFSFLILNFGGVFFIISFFFF